ncbi:FAS1 domain-containing protein, partial [Peziza echinospora]
RARHKHTDETIWDIISKCNHTTTLTKLAGTNAEFKHLLQDPKQNITLFAPSDHAFHKLLPHGLPDKLPKEMVYRVLNYHTAEGTVTSYEMMHRNTIVSRLQEDRLGKGMHQRLRIGLDNVHGPSVNFFSELTVVDIYAKNGVIHAINNVLLPPPRISTILDLIPTEFSTTLSALYKTGLVNTLLPPDHQHPRSGNDQPPTFPLDHAPGLTVFAPSNRDWEQLGPMCVAYLFSSHGADHLKALMKYHIVPNLTLYSDALDDPIHTPASSSSSSSDEHTIPQGHNHYTFKTLLEGADINVDIVRWERYLSFRVDGWGKIVVSDGLAGDGVLQVPGRVLVPGGKWVGEMGVQELKGRL